MEHIAVVSVPVSDQERARAFYVDGLGFQLVRDLAFGGDRRWLELGLPGARTTLSLVTWFDTMPPGSLRGLVVDCADLAAEVRRLAERGVECPDGIVEQPGGSFAHVADPDGNVVSLHQSGT